VVIRYRLARMILRASLLAEAAGGDKLPPPTRAAALMALLGIALLGMLIVVVILLGGHWARRQGSHRRGPSVPPDRRPLVSPVAEASHEDGADAAADSSAAETLHNGTTNHGETKAS